MAKYLYLNNFFSLSNDAPMPWKIFFQNSTSFHFEALVELHDDIMFYLIIIYFGVVWMIISLTRYVYYNNYSFYKLHKTIFKFVIVVIRLALILIVIVSTSNVANSEETADSFLEFSNELNSDTILDSYQSNWTYKYTDFIDTNYENHTDIIESNEIISSKNSHILHNTTFNLKTIFFLFFRIYKESLYKLADNGDFPSDIPRNTPVIINRSSSITSESSNNNTNTPNIPVDIPVNIPGNNINQLVENNPFNPLLNPFETDDRLLNFKNASNMIKSYISAFKNEYDSSILPDVFLPDFRSLESRFKFLFSNDKNELLDFIKWNLHTDKMNNNEYRKNIDLMIYVCNNMSELSENVPDINKYYFLIKHPNSKYFIPEDQNMGYVINERKSLVHLFDGLKKIKEEDEMFSQFIPEEFKNKGYNYMEIKLKTDYLYSNKNPYSLSDNFSYNNPQALIGRMNLLKTDLDKEISKMEKRHASLLRQTEEWQRRHGR